MAHIEKRINKLGEVSFMADVNLSGFPRTKKSFSKLRDAESWANKTELAIREGTFTKAAQAKLHTVREMIDRYLDTVLETKTDRRRYKNIQRAQLEWWKARLGELELANLTPAIIGESRDELLAGGKRKGSTVNRYLAALSHVITTAYKEWGWLPENPMVTVKKMKEPRGRVRFLTDDERERLLAACEDVGKENRKPLTTIVTLALATGARKNEILSLRREDVDLKRGIITVEYTKNGERRPLFLSKPVVEMLSNHIRRLPGRDGYIFFGRGRKPVEIDKEFRLAIKRARIRDFRFHDLRHTAASYLAMNDATTNEIAEILGHKTLNMVKRYAHLSKDHMAEVVSRMNERIFKEDS